MTPPRPFSAAEDAAIAAQWSRGPLNALAEPLGRPATCVHARARLLVQRGVLDSVERWQYHRRWTAAEEDLLADYWGEISDTRLARQLDRSPNALKIRSTRALGVSRKANWLCSRNVGLILGMDSKKVVKLSEYGVLRLRRSVVRAGASRAWRCDVEELERFLRERPEWYDVARIVEEPWRGIARAAHAADPVLTVNEAAKQLGVNPETVRLHLRRGWLTGRRLPHKGNNGVWLVHESALAGFRPRKPDSIGVVRAGSVADRPPAARKAPRAPKQRVVHVEQMSRPRYRPVEWRAS